MLRQILITSAAATLMLAHPLYAQNNDNSVTTHELHDGIYMLQGRGGNIGLSIGDDGIFMIDDKYAPMAENIKAEIAKLKPDSTVDYILNTHWHGDHTGGNEVFGSEGSLIVAHDNVRKRLESGGVISFFGAQISPASADALPVITFTEGMSFHVNGQTLDIMAVGPGNAHTDGDSVVFINPANVLHTGDIYFNGMYPFIDPDNGGSVAGVIEAVDEMLEKIDDDTVVIPGHGPISNKAELMAYRDMLAGVSENINALKADGKSIDEIVAAKPTADFDEAWSKGFIKPDKWVKLVTPLL